MCTRFYEYFEKTERPDLETVKRMKLRGCDDWNVTFENVCKNGDMEMYKFFVENGADDDNESSYYGLQGACEGGHMELVKLFMDQTDDYYGAFVYACHVIQLGADPSLFSRWELTYQGSSEVSRYLVQVYPSLFNYFEWFRYTADLDLYKMYLRQRGGVINPDNYKCLVSCQHPLYYVVINHYQQENRMIRMLPVDVWKLIMPFI